MSKNKKTVVQILRAPVGGIRKHVYDILLNLPEDSFEHIFITDMKDADYALPTRKNIKVFSLDIKEKPGLKDLLNLVRIYRILLGINPDVIHGHGAKGGLYARIVAYFLRAKCFYTPHGGSLHRVHGRLKNFVYDIIEIFLIPFTDLFVFESGYSRDLFSKNVMSLGDRAAVNYNGVEIPPKAAPRVYRAGEELKVASFGLLRHLKGHDIAIEAFRLLKLQDIPFSYNIYGKGEELEALNELIIRYSLQDKVKILDYTNDVPGEMLKQNFVLHPSRYESFGYVPLEAMVLKIPVVLSHEGGLAEVADPDTGFIAYGNRPQEYATIFADIYNGRDDVSSKVENAYRKAVDDFSREKMLRTIAEFYS